MTPAQPTPVQPISDEDRLGLLDWCKTKRGHRKATWHEIHDDRIDEILALDARLTATEAKLGRLRCVLGAHGTDESIEDVARRVVAKLAQVEAERDDALAVEDAHRKCEAMLRSDRDAALAKLADVQKDNARLSSLWGSDLQELLINAEKARQRDAAGAEAEALRAKLKEAGL